VRESTALGGLYHHLLGINKCMFSKINSAVGLKRGLSGGAKAWSPEFKPQYHQKKKKISWECLAQR
jgi:hypothetical protein